MQLNEKAFALGRKCSIIREIFEYSKTRASEIGADKVYDFSLGNPSFESPQEVTDTIKRLLKTENATLLHGYTSAQGDAHVRKVTSELRTASIKSISKIRSQAFPPLQKSTNSNKTKNAL